MGRRSKGDNRKKSAPDFAPMRNTTARSGSSFSCAKCGQVVLSGSIVTVEMGVSGKVLKFDCCVLCFAELARLVSKRA